MTDAGNHGQLQDSADTLRVLLLEDNPLDSELTLQELRIKSFFPADAESATNFHRWAADDRKAAAVASPAA